MIYQNTILETKNAEFFKHIFPLKTENISHAVAPSQNSFEYVFEGLRRSKGQRKETSFGDDFYTYLVENELSTYFKVVASPNAQCWKEAIKIEIDSINKNKTWGFIDLPLEAKSIGCKWIFKRKYNPDESIDKYKFRLVAKGFTQKPNIDYFDTFAPATRIASIRVLIALALIYKIFIQ